MLREKRIRRVQTTGQTPQRNKDCYDSLRRKTHAIIVNDESELR